MTKTISESYIENSVIFKIRFVNLIICTDAQAKLYKDSHVRILGYDEYVQQYTYTPNVNNNMTIYDIYHGEKLRTVGGCMAILNCSKL